MIASAATTRSSIAAWIAARPRWLRWALALAAGGLATLGHAPFHIVPSYVVAIVVFAWLIDASAGNGRALPLRMLAGAAAGWWFGLGHYLSGFYWIMSAFMVDAQTFGALAIPAWLAFAGGLALFWALAGALAVLLWTPDLRRIASFVLAIMAAEWLRGHVFGGFPWLLPGYVWVPGEPMSQLAALVGIYGLSAVTLLLFAAPMTLVDSYAAPGARFAPMLVAASLFGLAWGWGAQRLDHAPVNVPGALPVVRVAESGMTQQEKWTDNPDQEWRVLARYQRASLSPQESRAQVVIWPEGAIPKVNFFALENPAFLDAIGAGLGDRALVMGLTRRELRHGDVVYFNSAIVIDGVSGRPRIDMTQVYDKHRLVPWGEFIPLWSVFSRFNIAPLQEIGAGFTPGAPPTRLVIPDAPPAVILICYEAIFPGMVPRGEERPSWIIAISNDSWFGNGTGPYQHFEAARYRSIEEGLPMARAASGGFSAIVDSFGRVVRQMIQREGGVEAQLPPALPPTPHANWGFVLIPLLAACIAALRFAPFPAPGQESSDNE